MKLSNSDRKNALKHTYVKIILILLRMSWKLFALRHILYWVYVYMWYANSFLHPLLPKVIVVLLFVHGLDEIKHSTLVKKGSVSLNLQWYFFVLKWKFYFILQPETDPNHKWASRWDYILDSMPHTKIQWFR